MEYYYYIAEFTPQGNPSGTIEVIIPINAPSSELATTVDGIEGGTAYSMKIIPVRTISRDSYNNQMEERGQPSDAVTFETGKRISHIHR